MSQGRRVELHGAQRVANLAALVAVAAIGWAFLVESESAMHEMAGDDLIMRLMRAMMTPGDAMPYLLAATLMWIIMMVAMMIPAALPMAATFRGMDRGASPNLDTSVFVAGYLATWCAFAVAAAVLQWALHSWGLLRGMSLAGGVVIAGVLLMVAGAYQLTPLKEACLARCRSPLGFFLANWREGRAGAFSMGLRHGSFCVGCCWALMLLMFAGGAMSVATMAALCALVLAERLLPAGPWVAKLPGVAMVAGGALLLVRG